MIIENALVLCPDGKFKKKEICIRDGRFAYCTEDMRKTETAFADGTGCYAIPGLIDLHFHGAAGMDVCDASEEAFGKIAAYEALHGVTAICPATLTLPADTLMQTLRVGAAFAKKQREDPHREADLIGFNMEGPFISHARKGSQNENYILPANPVLAARFVDASGGLVRFIGLAPEENPDFENFIRAVKDKVTVSLAHTDADYDTAMRAFRAGAGHAVHLFNAMTGLMHRAPGVVGAVSDSPCVTAEIICDGIHVHPAAVRAAFKMTGAERLILISDSLRCTGMPDGEYLLGGRTVVKHGKYCTLKEGGLAGSVTNLMDCVKFAVQHIGIPLATAVSCASKNPSKALHIEDRYGSIEPGKNGNLVLLSADGRLETRAVIKDGVLLKGVLTPVH